jgi:hypothetical protein
MINFWKAKHFINGKIGLLILILINTGCPPPRLALTINTKQDDNIKIITKEEYGELKSYLIFNSDKLYLKLDGQISHYNFNDYRIDRRLSIGIYLKSKFDIRFTADSTKIIDNSGLKVFPHAHSIYHNNNIYKKNKMHDLGIVFHSNRDLALPTYLYLPKIELLKDNRVIRKIKFEKIELNVKRIQK